MDHRWCELVGSNQTQYIETNGLLGAGVYVQVTYYIADNARRMIRIETEVPPGAGDIDDSGTPESITEGGLFAASTQAASALWRVDGVDYVVSPATYLSDASGALTVGSTVLLNSYVDGFGNNVATVSRG